MPRDLTSQHLSILLARLADDAETAAVRYTELHHSLVRFFRNKGISEPHEAADETIDRVASRLATETVVDGVSAYAFGVARFVFLEKLRRERVHLRAAGLFYGDLSAPPTAAEEEDLELLRQCLDELYPADRELLMTYYSDVGSEPNRVRRQRLATQLQISLNTLRNRIARLKQRVGECVSLRRRV